MTLWSEDPETPSQIQEYIEENKGLEQKLLPYDILGNIAHVRMLEKQGYLEEEEMKEIVNILVEIYEDEPQVDGEDVHTFVEEKVTDVTPAGKKMHTGRSRNDQIVLDTRLYMKDSSIEVANGCLNLVESLEKFAVKKNMLMPGYTHQQQAMPSSTGFWASSFCDALVDDLKLLKSVYMIIDQNPLGAAAGYGTSLDVDRKYTTELLGFSSVQKNSLYCVSRGKQELMLLQVLDQIMLDLGKLSEDIINFSEDQEIFKIPKKFCTGSSIMPQKKNPDVLEITRAKSEEVHAAQEAIHGIISKLPSGYNRDSQQTKKYLIETVELVVQAVKVLAGLVSDLQVSQNFQLKEEIYAAYTANQMVESGKPFRDAHHKVKGRENYNINDNVKNPASQSYSDLENFWNDKRGKFDKAMEGLLNHV